MNVQINDLDPAQGLYADTGRLRMLVDERTGQSPSSRLHTPGRRRPLVISVAACAMAVAIGLPLLLRPDPVSIYAPRLEGIGDLPGVSAVVRLASGGVQTMAVDGDTIWVMTALAHELQRVSIASGDIEATYTIDGYVEGVTVGGGFVWLQAYDQGGRILRFDPARGAVDLTVPLGGAPNGARWFANSLWVTNDRAEGQRISSEGVTTATFTGELKGEGLGYLWVNDPETSLISSLDRDGTMGAIVIPSREGLETMSGSGVRKIIEANGQLWLLDGDYPFGTDLSRFDPVTGELTSFVSMTFGLIDVAEADGFLWVTSMTDDLLIRVDPNTSDVTRYPLPGLAGGIAAVDGSLWITLNHPGALVQIDPNAEFLVAGPVVVDDWRDYPHRLLCTGDPAATGPTIILEPYGWLDYGSWSVVQAKLSAAGHLVCADGYVSHEASPIERAASLGYSLQAEGVPGPYVLVAAGDGVHALRLFANGRHDLAGVVLIEPTPLGFPTLLDELAPTEPGGGSPMLDIDPSVLAGIGGFGDVPLTVIGGDPRAVFLSAPFQRYVGSESAHRLNTAWQEGLTYYGRLSTDSWSAVATGTGLHMVIWDRPELLVAEILDVVARAAG